MRWIDSRTLRLNAAEARAMKKFEDLLANGVPKEEAIEQATTERGATDDPEFVAYLRTRPERA